MSDEKPILQYRAMGSPRRGFRVVGVFRIPSIIKPHNSPTRTAQLKYHEYRPFQWRLTRSKAFTAANALNALNNLPAHEDTRK